MSYPRRDEALLVESPLQPFQLCVALKRQRSTRWKAIVAKRREASDDEDERSALAQCK